MRTKMATVAVMVAVVAEADGVVIMTAVVVVAAKDEVKEVVVTNPIPNKINMVAKMMVRATRLVAMVMPLPLGIKVS